MSWLAPLLFSALLCAPALAADSPVLATVDGQPITQADVDSLLVDLDPDARASLVGREAEILDQVITEHLLAKDALARKLDQTESGSTWLAQARTEALARLALREHLAAGLSDEAVKAWYDSHQVAFQRREAHVEHVLLASEADARATLAELQKGADFAETARARSQDPSAAQNGGDIGWIDAAQVVEPFAVATFAATPGALVGPVQTQFGWHVLRVVAFRDVAPVEDVAPAIRERLREELLESYVGELKAKATITLASGQGGASQVTLLAVAPSVPKDAPRWGTRGAPYTVMVFSDLQCPYCQRAHESIKRMIAGRTDVEVVLRHYPIDASCNANVTGNRHAVACAAARSIVCAGSKGADLTDDLFKVGPDLDPARLATVLRAYGGDAKKFTSCVAAPATTARVEADIADGVLVGVEGTPTVVIGYGGRWYSLDGSIQTLPAALTEIAAGK